MSLSLQFGAEAKRSPDASQSSSGDKVSLQSVSSRGWASAAAGKRKADGRASQSQKQLLTDPTGSQVKHDLCWLTPGTFLLPLRSDGAAYGGGSVSSGAWCRGVCSAESGVGMKPCAPAEKPSWVWTVCWQSASPGQRGCGMPRWGLASLGVRWPRDVPSAVVPWSCWPVVLFSRE